MFFAEKKKLIAGLVTLVLVLSVPLTLSLLQRKQESRSRASASTTLSLTPATSSVTTGSDVYLDLMINPGTNAVTYVRYHVTYDPAVLQPDATPFVLNTAAFPSSLEGPYLTSGSIIQSVSIGNDTTRVVTQPVKVGTLHFKAVGPTTSASSIAFGDKTLILSSATNDEPSENVLSTTAPALVTVTGSSVTPTNTVTLTNTPTSSPTQSPTATLVPTNPVTPTTGIGGGPTNTPVPTATTTLTPTSLLTQAPTTSPTSATNPTPTTTGGVTPTTQPANLLSLNILLHAIGSGGDNANPTGNTFSNKNPLHATQSATILFFNATNLLVASASGEVNYSSPSGNFTGFADISAVPEGNYTIVVKTPYHLARKAPGFPAVVKGQTLTIPQLSLVAGDVNNDNALSILDYNLIIDCFTDLGNPTPACDDNKKLATDLNDDGFVNATDYNLFLREITYQSGD